MSAALLQVEALSVRYGHVDALVDVAFTADDGEITAVLGANGAGKTTLLRTMTGLVRPRSGAVRFGDVDLTTMSVEDVVRHGVAHVPEGRGVIHELTVDENLRLGAMWRGRDPDRLAEILALFPMLQDRRRQMAASLSGGERQALAVARALMARPRVLLLDEPSLGLAPLITAQLMARLVTLAREEGLTIVLVEQNARTALSIADQAIVLNLGRVVVADRARTVAADDQLRRHFLGF